MSRAAYDPVTDRFYVQPTLIDYLAPAVWVLAAVLWIAVAVLSP